MKRGPFAYALLAIFFVGLLLVPSLARRVAADRQSARTALNMKTSLARHGFYLQEVSKAAGVNFMHEAPTLDSKLAGIMPEVA